MPLKVFGENGAYTSDIIEAISYAEANGADIVNCSFGSTEENTALKEAIAAADMLFVCSLATHGQIWKRRLFILPARTG
jgi:hypothetical protein